jgi:hypothetical protein
MIPIKHIDPEDLPLYAMQLLPPDEMEEMSLHLQHSVEARRVLAEIYGDLSLFAQTAEMHAPPALAKQRLMKHVAREKKAVPVSPLDRYAPPEDAYAPRGAASSLLDDEPVPPTFVEKAMPWAGWLLAAGIAAFAIMLLQQNSELKTTVASVRAQDAKTQSAAAVANVLLETMKDPSAVHATLTSLEAKPQPSGRVTYVADKGSLVFIASNLAQLQPEKTYELWVIPSDGRAPMPAGTFKPDEHGNASVVLPELAAGVPAKAFGVTIEAGDGSTVPTAPIILTGYPS